MPLHVFLRVMYLCVCRLEVRAYNPGTRHKYSTAIVRIQVTDVNDNAPFFPTYRPLFVHEGLSISTSTSLCMLSWELSCLRMVHRMFVLWHCWLAHLTRKNPSPIWSIMCLVGRQNIYLHWTVFPCSKDSSVHSWLISWLTPAPLTRYFHWWITNWMIDWLIDWALNLDQCSILSCQSEKVAATVSHNVDVIRWVMYKLLSCTDVGLARLRSILSTVAHRSPMLTGSVSGRPHSKWWWCHDIGYPLLAVKHSPCKAPWSGTPCRTTSAHNRTMSPLDSAWKPGFSLATSNCAL